MPKVNDFVKIETSITEAYKEQIAKILGKSDFYWKYSDIGYDYDNLGQWNLMHMAPNTYSTIDRETYIATFRLDPMPGCCGVVVANSASTFDPWRKKGLGSILHKMRTDMAKAAGFGIVLATDISDNTANVKIFDKNGWKKVYEFINPRTDNSVDVRVLFLDNYEPPEDDYDDDY